MPLVTGMAATTVMEFTDRLFLSHYSVNAISAVVPAGVSAFLILVFLGGVAGYISVFIAQYSGAGRPEKIGAVLWQGILFTVLSSLILFFTALFVTGPLFKIVGHAPEVRILEEHYFTILCLGGVLHVATQTFSGFFTGRGKTRPVMFANVMGMVVNIPLNYLLIFGKFGMAELGVKGAAIATVVSWGVTVLCLVPAVFAKHFRREFRMAPSLAIDMKIMGGLIRYGVPGALQFSLDVFAFTFFILVVGRMGTVPLAASNIVIAISSLAFMPTLGFSFGISGMAGQALGRGCPAEARAAAWSGIHLLLLYTLLLDICFIFFAEPIVAVFIDRQNSGETYAELLDMGTCLLQYVAVYIIFDVFYMTFAAVLKGAGDTRALLLIIGGSSTLLMIIPLSLGINYFAMDVYGAWCCLVLFVFSLALLTYLRYRGGKWEKMLVIRSV